MCKKSLCTLQLNLTSSLLRTIPKRSYNLWFFIYFTTVHCALNNIEVNYFWNQNLIENTIKCQRKNKESWNVVRKKPHGAQKRPKKKRRVERDERPTAEAQARERKRSVMIIKGGQRPAIWSYYNYAQLLRAQWERSGHHHHHRGSEPFRLRVNEYDEPKKKNHSLMLPSHGPMPTEKKN